MLLRPYGAQGSDCISPLRDIPGEATDTAPPRSPLADEVGASNPLKTLPARRAKKPSPLAPVLRDLATAGLRADAGSAGGLGAECREAAAMQSDICAP